MTLPLPIKKRFPREAFFESIFVHDKTPLLAARRIQYLCAWRAQQLRRLAPFVGRTKNAVKRDNDGITQ